MKSLDAPYAAGRRGAGWLKVKPVHTLDLVILAAEWGHGRRRGWLTNLHLGARDREPGGFVMLGKTFKGLTDEMLTWQTERLLELATERGDWVVTSAPSWSSRSPSTACSAAPAIRAAWRCASPACSATGPTSAPTRPTRWRPCCAVRASRASACCLRGRARPVQDPLADIRCLYDAWNAGNVARAAAAAGAGDHVGVVRRDAARAAEEEATLAGGSGGTWRLVAGAIDLLVGVGHHVIAFSRRSVAPRAPRPRGFEVWTVRDGKAEALPRLPAGGGSRRAARDDRRRRARHRVPRFAGVQPRRPGGVRRLLRGRGARAFAERLGGSRLDDVRVFGRDLRVAGDLGGPLHPDEASGGRPLHLVIGFADERARQVVPHPSPEAAVAAVARWTPA